MSTSKMMALDKADADWLAAYLIRQLVLDRPTAVIRDYTQRNQRKGH